MTYNRSAIMRRAWEIIRKADVARHGLSLIKSRALSAAWREAKAEAKYAAARPVADLSTAERELVTLENQRTPMTADLRRMDALREIVAAERAARMAEKRDLIDSAKGRICAVTFTKKDGSERTMKVQPAKLKFHVKGDAASEPARRASATRAARHPHLLPVWDTEAKAPRSVNLATVSRIAVNGHIHEFHAV
ncbi:hypothetical protein [Psychromarinibacter sp. S121]|uniref:hypothetical protein n=1 Tax=Psychromarinibacter sp. S121 TaxID=3415127 RepID=UPI003C7A8F15